MILWEELEGDNGRTGVCVPVGRKPVCHIVDGAKMLSGQDMNFFLLPMLMHDGIFLRKDSLAITNQADVMISLFLLKANHHKNGQMRFSPKCCSLNSCKRSLENLITAITQCLISL